MANWVLLDWVVAIGVLAGVVAALYAVLAYYRRTKPKTVNVIEGGNRNTQSGGTAETHNTIRNGDDNQQSG